MKKQPNNQILKKLFSISIFLILVALFIYYIKENISDFKQLSIVSPWLLIILVIIFLLTYFVISQITILLLKQLNVCLSQKESFALSIVTGFYNLITPFRGGMAVRAVYLKKKHKFAYVDFLATLSASYILIFLVASFMGLISTILIYLQTKTYNIILSVIFGGVFLVMLFIIIVSPKFTESKDNKWLNRFIKVINGWNLIKDNKKVVFSVALFSLIQILFGSLMIYLEFKVFGLDVGFIQSLFLTSISSLGILLAITPGNLGINEAIIVFSAATIGITPIESLSAALLGRAVSLVVLFILGLIFSYTLIKKPITKK